MRGSRAEGAGLAVVSCVPPKDYFLKSPAGTATGQATITITSRDGPVSAGTINVTAVAPVLFCQNGNGQGAAAAYAIHVKPDKSQTSELLAVFDTRFNQWVPSPIDLGPAEEQVFLELFGSGIR